MGEERWLIAFNMSYWKTTLFSTSCLCFQDWHWPLCTVKKGKFLQMRSDLDLESLSLCRRPWRGMGWPGQCPPLSPPSLPLFLSHLLSSSVPLSPSLFLSLPPSLPTSSLLPSLHLSMAGHYQPYRHNGNNWCHLAFWSVKFRGSVFFLDVFNAFWLLIIFSTYV